MSTEIEALPAAGNYAVSYQLTATLKIQPAGGSSSGGGSSGGGGSDKDDSDGGSHTTAKTEKHPDGSSTTTVTDKKTGAVTETTKRPDGSQTVVETKKDGTVTTTVKDNAGNRTETVARPDGSASTTETRKDGTKVETQTTKGGATTATVTVPEGKDSVRVTIPTPETPTAGTVAVLVKPDGTREVVKTCVPEENGVSLTLAAGARLEIVDNSKDFPDLPETHWAAEAVDFVTARELFSGTSENTFTPDAPMTRAMLWTVLARLDGREAASGGSWYAGAMAWAVESGLSDGANPEGQITREQLAVMLWRYAGSPAAGSLAGFPDAEEAGDYAREALGWAVEQGVLTGKSGGVLDPKAQATRTQVAAMLMRYLTGESK